MDATPRDARATPRQVTEALKRFDRKKDSEDAAEANAEALKISSAIGTETPITVLMDIRQCIREQSELLRGLNDKLVEAETCNATRHREILALMCDISDGVKLGTSTGAAHNLSTPGSLSPAAAVREYYYGGDKLATKNSVAGCVLMQMFNAAQRHSPDGAPHQADTMPMDLRSWSSLVSIVVEAESNITQVKGKLALPKQSTYESTTASELVSSTTQGRMTVCKLENFKRLQDECPAVSSSVEEIRRRVVACPGLVSQAKCRVLSRIGYPFVTKDGSFNITDSHANKGGSEIVVSKVSHFNVPQKKVYAVRVLKDGMKPMMAATDVERSK